ncbi:LPS export ABC transporter periplasmic protein LptC [Mesorhizobium sp. BE184]|uniref:LPS export ABC transporter periplasmic protein LptC n=1 Tax=unclassified Mesorhizobium TaxID=325217 RepID=UPI0006F338D5|nr:LPS export ABC transporter periplasmic protein LptC [Mesorhizobium sp. Root1471]KQZ38470.1 LPS export ABC transporter periplasmic protein LptC [Mesorhizobium sp. Root554]
MLARPTKAKNVEQDVTATTNDTSGLEVAFGNAQRHSQRVRFLKLALPLAAAIIAIAFPVYSYMVAPAAVPVKTENSAFSDGKLVMANPKLEGFTKQNLPYSMNAIRAVQDASKENIIELEGIDAKLPIDEKTTATINAARGIYDRENNTIDLDSAVTVSTNDGMVVKLKSAFLDMGKGNMKTNDPVDITRDGSRISSDTMSVENNGKILIFEKRVRVNIDPAKLKTAENQSGETNAAQ